MKNDPVQTALSDLDGVSAATAEGRKALLKALESRYNLVVTKAAKRIAAEHAEQCVPALATAFIRLIDRGAAADKGCAALNAIARALHDLDHDDAQLFLRGIRHRQMEAVWGGSVDTAAELRGICAMGLVNCTYADKLRELVPLLVDPEWQARAGAVRAMAIAGPEAGLLLRLKALTNDDSPDVMAECLTAIIGLEGAKAIEFVAQFARSPEPDRRDAALLALGSSRRADAIDWLITRFGEAPARDEKQAILLALSTSRTDAALDFLIALLRSESASESKLADEALAIHTGDAELRRRIEEVRR